MTKLWCPECNETSFSSQEDVNNHWRGKHHANVTAANETSYRKYQTQQWHKRDDKLQAQLDEEALAMDTQAKAFMKNASKLPAPIQTSNPALRIEERLLMDVDEDDVEDGGERTAVGVSRPANPRVLRNRSLHD